MHKSGTLAALFALGLVVLPAWANRAVRQYYDAGWTYNEINNYHYSRYNYKPTVAAPSYSYHYVIYYPRRPRYYYYYNPVRKVYWGRYELDENGKGKGYSLLAEKDRKENLTDIPEAAFPKPGEMPEVPEAKESLKMDAPTLQPPADK